ncbi:MAG: hypothetical protein A2Z98_06440 [Spirochaetes bacterium GWB1_27_13]|nr:MAG: hypothetical protein A2Z98_06440 [Spirochaetes bacterium GWB1_27_13]
MEKRVFQIDQECFIIYAEDFSTKNERFLRVGNSPFLKDFGEGLTFMSLVTPLYPGNPFKEIEIFRPDIDKKIIGLKNVVERFTKFLEHNEIDISKIEIIYAEEEGLTKDKKLTEEEFLQDIKNSTISRHSFASFYGDGNIRIFNKNQLFFDLKDYLNRFIDEKREIELLSDFFLKNYQNFYNKTGIIHSDKSLFIFSDNKFACLSDSKNWVLDAIKVGINPEKIDFLYLTEKIEPDSLWIKSFLKKWSSNSRIHIVLKEINPNWLNLLPKDVFMSVFPEKDSIDIKIGDIRLFFQNKRINIIYNMIKINLEGESGFLDKGSKIQGFYLLNEKKKDFGFIIDDFDKEFITLFSYNPLIFTDNLNENNYISNFWDNLKEFVVSNRKEINFKEDYLYKDDFILDKKNKNDFFSKLYFETIRRTLFEANPDVELNFFNEYKEYLCDFTGKLINNNKIIIEQRLGFSQKEEKIIARDFFCYGNFFVISDKINPYEIFQKDIEIAQWKKRYKNFKDVKLKSLTENNISIINHIENRFKDVMDAKEFYQKERDELRKFISQIEKIERNIEKKRKIEEKKHILNKKDENIEKKDINDIEDNYSGYYDDFSGSEILDYNYKTSKKKIKEEKTNIKKEKLKKEVKDFEKQIKKPKEKINDFEKIIKKSKRMNLKIPKRILLIFLIILILSLVTFGLVNFIPKIKLPQFKFWDFKIKKDSKKIKKDKKIDDKNPDKKQKDKKITNQKEFIENIKEKYNIEKDKPLQKSYYYSFYMTTLDNLNLTNLIAIKNGYHRILFDFEKNYVKGQNPDWIYPKKVLILPDNSKITVKAGDTMWGICETYLIKEVNKNEIEIRSIIEKTKTRELSIPDAKEEFVKIKSKSNSEMVKGFLGILLFQNDFDGWEPYLKK